MFKLILPILAVLLFSACSGPKGCKDAGYTGIVLSANDGDFISCSNGDLTPDQKYYLTANGNKDIAVFTYIPFTLKETKEQECK